MDEPGKSLPFVPAEDVLEGAALEALFQSQSEHDGFAKAVLCALGAGEIGQRNGAYLLRKFVSRSPLPDPLSAELGALFAQVTDAKARLHLCQAIASHFRSLNPPPEPCATFLRTCREAKNPHQRAWAIAATHALAQAYPRFQLEAFGAQRNGARDPSPVVREKVARLAK